MEEELPEAPPARRWTKRRIFGAMFVLLVLLLAFAWWKRVDIADSYVRDYLEKNDVRATYEIEDIGFRAQRIRNVIVAAAYFAVADEGIVTMAHLLHATRRELQKLGRLTDESDFYS